MEGAFHERFRGRFTHAATRIEVDQESTAEVDDEDLDTGCTVWSAGIWLADACARADTGVPDLIAGRRLLELGAGTGIAGLAAASAGAAEVVLSDREKRLSLLKRNVSRNGWVALKAGARPRCVALDWAQPAEALEDSERLGGGYAADLIVGADLVHDTAQCGPLVTTVRALLKAWPACLGFLWSQELHCRMSAYAVRRQLAEDPGLSWEELVTPPGGFVVMGWQHEARSRARAGVMAPADLVPDPSAAGGLATAPERASPPLSPGLNPPPR